MPPAIASRGDRWHLDVAAGELVGGGEVGGERLQRGVADLDRLGAGGERVDEAQVRVGRLGGEVVDQRARARRRAARGQSGCCAW